MGKIILSLVMVALIFAGCGADAAEIGADRAKQIALEHAGFTQEQVKHIQADRENDDGRTVYDVEFYTEDKREYDYEIDATTGEIVSHDFDAEGITPQSDSNAEGVAPQADTNASQQNTSVDAGKISEEQAKQIALEKVPGATDADIREFKKDYDDSREEYDGKIIYNNTEYEFEIDAETGKITKWDSEPVHD